MPKIDIAGSSGRSIFNFLRDLQINFQSDCSSFQSPQQWRYVHILKACAVTGVFFLAILIGVKWNHMVVLTYICLISKYCVHFFKCFSVTQDSSVLNSMFSSIPHVLVGLFVFLVGL
jgi:glucan phosphoethanolaminetransferase (alkaline phosphatase superfamily)